MRFGRKKKGKGEAGGATTTDHDSATDYESEPIRNVHDAQLIGSDLLKPSDPYGYNANRKDGLFSGDEGRQPRYLSGFSEGEAPQETTIPLNDDASDARSKKSVPSKGRKTKPTKSSKSNKNWNRGSGRNRSRNRGSRGGGDRNRNQDEEGAEGGEGEEGEQPEVPETTAQANTKKMTFMAVMAMIIVICVLLPIILISAGLIGEENKTEKSLDENAQGKIDKEHNVTTGSGGSGSAG